MAKPLVLGPDRLDQPLLSAKAGERIKPMSGTPESRWGSDATRMRQEVPYTLLPAPHAAFFPWIICIHFALGRNLSVYTGFVFCLNFLCLFVFLAHMGLREEKQVAQDHTESSIASSGWLLLFFFYTLLQTSNCSVKGNQTYSRLFLSRINDELDELHLSLLAPC